MIKMNQKLLSFNYLISFWLINQSLKQWLSSDRWNIMIMTYLGTDEITVTHATMHKWPIRHGMHSDPQQRLAQGWTKGLWHRALQAPWERGRRGGKERKRKGGKGKREKEERIGRWKPATEVPSPLQVLLTRPHSAISARPGAMGTRWGMWPTEAELTSAMGLAWGVIYCGSRCENWTYNDPYMSKSAQNQAKMRHFSRLFSTQIQPYSTCGTSIWPHDDSREH